MNVLVTGGAGFIGSNVVQGLVSAGVGRVTVLDDLSTGFAENLADVGARVELVRGDVRDASLVQRLVADVDAIFHLAARVGNVRSFEAPLEDGETNVLGTRTLLHAASKRSSLSFIYSSSAAIFGESKYLPVDEDHPVVPDSPYGVSKLAAERDTLCYAKAFGIRAVCLRYFNVYGRHQRFDAYGNVIPIFAERVHAGRELTVYGDGEQTRDFVDVRDVVAANLAALRSSASGVFNIGTGRQSTVNQLVEIVRRHAGKAVEVRHAPSRAGEVRDNFATIARATAQLGYAPSVDLQTGVCNYLDWFASDRAKRPVASSV